MNKLAPRSDNAFNMFWSLNLLVDNGAPHSDSNPDSGYFSACQTVKKKRASPAARFTKKPLKMVFPTVF